MKFLMQLLVVIMFFGFAGGVLGCDGGVDSPPVEGEKIAPEMGEPVLPGDTGFTPTEEPLLKSQEAEVSQVKGLITAINPEIGQVTIKDESDKEIVLMVGKDISLEDYNVGDQVVVEHNRGMLIKSINRQ
jgi:hypothetical protein